MEKSSQITDVIEVCTDGSELSEKGIAAAVALAKSFGLTLVGMTAAPESADEAKLRERLAVIGNACEEAGVPCELVLERANAPWEAVLAVAARYDARYIVMASRGLGSIGSLILGSETQKVLAATDRPVLVVR